MNYWGGASAFGAREYGSLTDVAIPSYYPSDTQVTTGPTGLPVNIQTVKQFIVEYNLDSDDLLNVIIGAVTEQIENYLGRDILTKTRKALYYNVGRVVYLMPVPVASITSVQSLDEDGTATSLTLNTDYYVRGLKDNVQIYNIDAKGDSILQVIYQSGYGAASSVPAAIQQAIIQESARQFKRRQDPGIESFNMVNAISPETYALLQSYIVRRPV